MTAREWLVPATPPQPRHPRLTRLLERNQARLRAVKRRAARRLLAESGLSGVLDRQGEQR